MTPFLKDPILKSIRKYNIVIYFLYAMSLQYHGSPLITYIVSDLKSLFEKYRGVVYRCLHHDFGFSFPLCETGCHLILESPLQFFI